MSLIEGVGDEVTAVFAVILLLLVICLAWVSTNIRDIPFFSVIIVELTNGGRRRATEANRGDSPVSDSEGGSSEHAQEEQEVVDSGSVNEETSDNIEQNSAQEVSLTAQNLSLDNQDTSDSSRSDDKNGEEIVRESDISNKGTENVVSSKDIETENSKDKSEQDDNDLSETELRRRRVEFFQRQSSAKEPILQGSVSQENSSHPVVNKLEKSQNGASESAIASHSEASSINQSETSVINKSDSKNSNKSDLSDAVGSGSSNVVNESRCCHLKNRCTTKDSANPGGSNSGQNNQNQSSNPLDGESFVSQINIRLKYLNDTQRSVIASPNDTIGQFRRANFAAELSENKLVRFIFNGQDLRNDANTLQAYNIVDNSVIHCLITQANRNAESPRRHHDDIGFDIGMLMLPLFGLIICLVWYLRFEYRQFFTATSTVSLIGVTFLYLAAVLASWEGRRRGHAHEHVE